jgi:ubiquinone/menaquinone biosynthesis C-methylase UbiE
MGTFVEFFTPLHQRTSRNYLARMVDEKVHCMEKAREYEADYWDGDRRYGYGGYAYDGRWKPLAEDMIAHYGLSDMSKVLDVGCGKAHLLYEIQQLLPGAELHGFDVSKHGIATAPERIRPQLQVRAAQDSPYPWPDAYFDLVLCLGVFQNLRLFELELALKEIERVGKQKFVMVESYRNAQEMFNLECWALTMHSLLDTDEWLYLYDRFGYTGDYEFIFFE